MTHLIEHYLVTDYSLMCDEILKAYNIKILNLATMYGPLESIYFYSFFTLAGLSGAAFMKCR